jgi:hypothetical protein
VGHQSRDSAIAIEEGMYPKKAMVCGRYRNDPSGFREALRIVRIGKARQKCR